MRTLHFRRRGKLDLQRARSAETRPSLRRGTPVRLLSQKTNTPSRTSLHRQTVAPSFLTHCGPAYGHISPRRLNQTQKLSPRKGNKSASDVTKVSFGSQLTSRGHRSSVYVNPRSGLHSEALRHVNRTHHHKVTFSQEKTRTARVNSLALGRRDWSSRRGSRNSSTAKTSVAGDIVERPAETLTQPDTNMVSQAGEPDHMCEFSSPGVGQGSQLSPCPFTVLSGRGVYSSPTACKTVQSGRSVSSRPHVSLPERATTFRILPPEPSSSDDKENISSSVLTSIRRKIKSLCESDSGKDTKACMRNKSWDHGWHSIPSVSMRSEPVPELPVASFSRISIADSGYRSSSRFSSWSSLYSSLRRRRRSATIGSTSQSSEHGDSRSEHSISRPNSKDLEQMLGQTASDPGLSQSFSDVSSIQSRPLPPLPRQNPEPLPPCPPIPPRRMSQHSGDRRPSSVPPSGLTAALPASAPDRRVHPPPPPHTLHNQDDSDSQLNLTKTINLSNVLRNKWVSGMAVTKKGEIIIADLRDVYILDDEGNLKRTLGAGRGAGRLVEPIDVTVLTNGNIAVSDHADRSIKIFTCKGQFVRVIRGPGLVNIAGVASNERREILVAATDSRCISIHSEEGSTVGQIPGNDAVKRSTFDHPYSLAVNPLSGAVIVGDDYKQRVTAVSCEGRILWRFCPTGDRIFFPSSICVDATGYVFIADLYNEKVYMLDSGGKYLKTVLARGQGLRGGPGSVAVDHQGHLLVADEEKTIKIFRYETGGFALARRYCEGPNYVYS